MAAVEAASVSATKEADGQFDVLQKRTVQSMNLIQTVHVCWMLLISSDWMDQLPAGKWCFCKSKHHIAPNMSLLHMHSWSSNQRRGTAVTQAQCSQLPQQSWLTTKTQALTVKTGEEAAQATTQLCAIFVQVQHC